MDYTFLDIINRGKNVWNRWVLGNPTEIIDLSGLDLSNRDLSGYDFSVITAQNTNFSNCTLVGTDFSNADLMQANFNDANITKATFAKADLLDASLVNVRAIETDFYQASLQNANLSDGIFLNAQFAMSLLVSAKLNRADITDAKLWETQRILWSINDIKCERCFWGEHKYNPPSEYEEGEFERLHKYAPIVKVHFPQGIKPLEFYSVPHLVHGVATMFDGCTMRISSVSEAGKGAEVHIVLEEYQEEQLKEIKTSLNDIPSFLREDQNKTYLEGINKGLSQAMDKLLQKLIEKK